MMPENARIARKIRAGKSGAVSLRSSRTNLILLSAVFMIFGIWIIVSSLLAIDSGTMMFGIVVGSLIVAFALVFFVSPMFKGHMLTSSNLIVRYGILFRQAIPLDGISKVVVEGSWRGSRILLGKGIRLGVEYSIIDRRFTVLRSKHGIVRLVLKDELIVDGLFGEKELKEIAFDTVDSDLLIDRVERTRDPFD